MRQLPRIHAALILAGSVLASNAFAQPQSIVSQQRRLEIHGSAADDRFGRPALFADLNNDGYDDLIVGSDRSDFTGGQRRTVYLFKGGPGFFAPDLIDLSAAGADSVILGETGSTALATALASGDLNDDGIPDLVLGDASLTVSGRAGAGAVYILFGAANFFDTSSRDLATGAWNVKMLGAAAGDNTTGSTIFGGGISHALACGDIDNDGIDDLAIGAHLSAAGGPADSGSVAIVKGRTPFANGTTIDLASQANYRIFGDDTYDELGIAVSMGDINNDTLPDLVLGVRYSSVGTFTDEGYLYVFFGRSSFPATTNLGSASASVQIRHTEANAHLGEAVALGDINGDNLLDVVAMADGWDGVGNTSNDFGAVHAFFGRTTWVSSFTTAADDMMISGYSNSASIGATLASGDVNGDGIDDMLFTSRDTERVGFNTEGRTFVKYGAVAIAGDYSLQLEQVDAIINGNEDGLQLGDHLAVGDPDGDDVDEVLLAAPFVDSTTGRVYLFDLLEPRLIAQSWMMY